MICCFVLQVWIIIEKRDISFFPFCCKAPERHQTCLFLTKIAFLWPRSVLSAVPTPFFLCFCDYPLPQLESNGTVLPGLSTAWTVPLFRDFWGERGESLWRHGAWKGKHRVVRQSTSFLLAPSFCINLVRGKTSVRFILKHPAVRVCVCVCFFLADFCRLMKVVFMYRNKQARHTSTHSHKKHNCCYVPQCFSLQLTSSCCPPVGGAEVKSASQCFCLYLNTVFYYFSSNCL